jgi:hypothetical protein
MYEPPPTMPKMRRFCLTALSLFALPSLATGQSLRTSSERAVASRAAAEVPHDSILARGLVFRGIGPSLMGGRITEIAVAERGRLGTVVYIGAATGGLWRSTNAGVSWTALFDSVRAGQLSDASGFRERPAAD